MPVLCLYCHQPAKLVTGAEVYPNRSDLHFRRLYMCEPCGAYVGCHPGTIVPLGRLANAELRLAKMAAHAAFDPLWKSGRFTRKEAYQLLADTLNIKRQDCHIGEFDLRECQQVVEAVQQINRGGELTNDGTN